jgi:hypothetical protein
MTITITKASAQMTPDDRAKMLALKEEYSKLSTTTARMKAIYGEMVALRSAVSSTQEVS